MCVCPPVVVGICSDLSTGLYFIEQIVCRAFELCVGVETVTPRGEWCSVVLPGEWLGGRCRLLLANERSNDDDALLMTRALDGDGD